MIFSNITEYNTIKFNNIISLKFGVSMIKTIQCQCFIFIVSCHHPIFNWKKRGDCINIYHEIMTGLRAELT